MPDPIWSFTYNVSASPEAQGFTRFIHEPAPTITIQTTGPSANRRVQVNTDAGGDVSFLTSNVPALNSTAGFTAEALMSVNGVGNGGFEATFLDKDVQVLIYQTKAQILLNTGVAGEVITASNASDTLWRATFDGTHIRLYRAGVLVLGPLLPTVYTSPYQRFQFWAEGGGTVIVKAMKYFIAGAVVPG
jgi:hypothetical protein